MSDYTPMKKKSISSFDVLPNEILFLIFDYLTSNEIIYSFIDCNQRLKRLLITQKYCLKIPTTNLNFWNETLPLIGSQIQTLIINIDYLTVSLDLFSNLTSIIISSPYSLLDGQLKSILNHQCFQQLHTFKISDTSLSRQLSDTNVLDDEQILFRKIFDNNNKLEVFQYLQELGELSYRNLDQLNSNIHIRSLTLHLPHFQDIFILIQHTPNLIYLNIQSQMPYKISEEYPWKSISEMKLEEFYFKFKSSRGMSHRVYLSTSHFDKIFRVIQLFSSSLITLSLDFSDKYLMNSTNVLFNGIELENKLLKPMKKLQNFYFYIRIHECENVKQILSTFQTFPRSIGAHQNTYLYSLPSSFHELKYFHHFEDVLSNNDEILKDNDRLWSKVTSLELIRNDQIDFKNLFPLIKLNMPKLSSITFHGKDHYNFFSSYDADDSDDSCDKIERINVQLDSVTIVRLEEISMKQVQEILIHSFPNLQCLILVNTKLVLEENELTLFLGQKLQRIESDEFFLGNNTLEEKDFSYFINLQHIKLTYGLTYNDELFNRRSQIVSHLLSKLPKLETLSIYAIPCNDCVVYYPEDIFHPILNGLNENQIKTEYKIKYSGDYMWFIRNTVSWSF